MADDKKAKKIFILEDDSFSIKIYTSRLTKVGYEVTSTPNANEVSRLAEDFSPDGRALYYTTDEGSEFSYIMKYNIETDEKEKVLEKSWDIMGSYFTHNGKYMVTYINEDGKNIIEVKDRLFYKRRDRRVPQRVLIQDRKYKISPRIFTNSF